MKNLILVFLFLLSTSANAQEINAFDSQVLNPATTLTEKLSNKDILSQCCKVCTKGCPCGNTCISCSKDCHVGPGCACREPMELGNRYNQSLEPVECKI